MLLAWFVAACGGPKEQQVRAPLRPATAPASADTGLHYADVTQQAGIDFVQSIGDATLNNLVESVGGGAAWLDYDQDGYLDLYVVSGTYLPGLSEGPKPRVQYHNHLLSPDQDYHRPCELYY